MYRRMVAFLLIFVLLFAELPAGTGELFKVSGYAEGETPSRS